ncbi:hypothetical protein FIBSPDRAFT_1023946 [Athelia psychrophila]|uniref:BCS1 N-terminal domain-containing protein n=1 Tax=Athelia psychrophila TaxID=1759441 RepID=A0A166IKB4_9AGAM|nr:hypothetical protein FIBSPDRAFT_1023946 [Fibularhizoctonia sp. CBS 109695]
MPRSRSWSIPEKKEAKNIKTLLSLTSLLERDGCRWKRLASPKAITIFRAVTVLRGKLSYNLLTPYLVVSFIWIFVTLLVAITHRPNYYDTPDGHQNSQWEGRQVGWTDLLPMKQLLNRVIVGREAHRMWKNLRVINKEQTVASPEDCVVHESDPSLTCAERRAIAFLSVDMAGDRFAPDAQTPSHGKSRIAFFLTAHFSEEDFTYDWLMLWLSRQPEWQHSREFETTTRTTTPGFNSTRTADNSFGDLDDLDGVNANEDDDVPGKVKTRVVFQPAFDTTHTIYYRGHWLRVRRGRKQDGSNHEMLSISVVARNNTILKQLVLQAKKEYEAEAVHRIQIYFADSHGGWRWTDSRHKRPLSSIVLNPGVKEMLLNDTKDFLKSEKWYADRGIPFRRGYLLHVLPIHAIAGELMLDIYTLSLLSSWISDGILTILMSRVPARCIVLLEDLDAAFTRSVTRDSDSTGTPSGGKNKDRDEESIGPMAPPSSSRSRRSREANLSDVNTLALSGLLNALDSVAASEGRILFATTNHLERLDPALNRPGRMDVWVDFRNASKWQAEALFRNFFPPTEEESATKDAEMEKELRGIDLPTTPIPQSSTMSTLWSMSPSSLASSVDLSSVSPPSSPSHSPASSNSAMPMPGLEMFGAKNRAYMPPPVEENIASLAHSAKPLDAAKLAFLAKKFADGCSDEEFGVAALQGCKYLRLNLILSASGY